MNATRSGTGINAGDPTRPRLLEGIASPPDWTLDALCTQVDTDLFFPEKGGSTARAKAICLSCTVRTDCLDSALANQEGFGIWGGLSERERRRLTRHRRPGYTTPTLDREQPA